MLRKSILIFLLFFVLSNYSQEENLVDEDFKQSLVSYNAVDKHKFYGFTNNELFSFIRLLFDSIEAFYKFRNVFI